MERKRTWMIQVAQYIGNLEQNSEYDKRNNAVERRDPSKKNIDDRFRFVKHTCHVNKTFAKREGFIVFRHFGFISKQGCLFSSNFRQFTHYLFFCSALFHSVLQHRYSRDWSRIHFAKNCQIDACEVADAYC